MATILVTVAHPDGLDQIQRVKIDCESLGWGPDSQVFLYDDGKSHNDRYANNGTYTGRFVIFPTVEPGAVRLPIRVEDVRNQTVTSSVVLNVVENLNGMY